MIATLTYKGISAKFSPNEFKLHVATVGKRNVLLEKSGNLYDVEEGINGADYRHWIFIFEELDEDTKESLEQIYLSKPKKKDPAVLTVKDKKYAVIFSPIQQAYDFPEYITDLETGKKFYSGSLVLLEIRRLA